MWNVMWNFGIGIISLGASSISISDAAGHVTFTLVVPCPQQPQHAGAALLCMISEVLELAVMLLPCAVVGLPGGADPAEDGAVAEG